MFEMMTDFVILLVCIQFMTLVIAERDVAQR